MCSKGVSFIWFVEQMARASFMRKLVLLCRLIIMSPCYQGCLKSSKTEMFICLLVNLKTDQQPDFSHPLFISATHYSKNNQKLRSPNFSLPISLNGRVKTGRASRVLQGRHYETIMSKESVSICSCARINAHRSEALPHSFIAGSLSLLDGRGNGPSL